MSISIDKELARDLIDSKLRELDKKIKLILTKWNFDNVDDFVQATKDGKLEEESIDDAISIQNLVDKRDEYSAILS